MLAGVPQVNRHRFPPQPAIAVVPGTAGLWLPGTAYEVGIGAFMNESSSEVNGPRSEDEHGPPFEHKLLAREVMHDSEPRTMLRARRFKDLGKPRREPARVPQ